MKLKPLISACILFVAIHSPASMGAAEPSPEIRIVDCDAAVQSPKRGVCLNEASDADFMALAPGVSWYYTWHHSDTVHAPAAAKMTFIPMAWGDREADVEGLADYLADHKPPFVLAINEPNLRGQAFITPEQTATLYQKIKAVADKAGVPVIGPNMALGSAPDASITAFDPLENKEVTYTYQEPFMKAFFHYVGDTEVPAVASHTYGNASELSWMIGAMHKEFGRPVWITEFADWHAKDDAAEMDYLIQSVDLMERTPYVHGYAWFKERLTDNTKLSLLEKASGRLTPLGQAYVQMPVHDPNIFYRIPGRLELERYTTMQSAEIGQTKDEDGFLEMKISEPTQSLTYQLYSNQAQTFASKLRVATTDGGTIRISANGKALATFTADRTGWQTLEQPIPLPKGASTIEISANQATRLNWLEFNTSAGQ